MVEWVVIEYKRHELLAQCVVYKGYFQRLYESTRGKKEGEQVRRVTEKAREGKKKRGKTKRERKKNHS